MNSRSSAINGRYQNPDSDPRGPYLFSDVTSPFERPSLQYEWFGHYPPQGRSWRYSRERAAILEAEGRIALSSSGRPLLKRYLSEVESNTNVIENTTTSSQLDVIVRTAMKAIASEIAKNPRCLRDIEWRDLERVMREVFELLGFTTELTRSGKDGGFDIRLESKEHGETHVFLVEIKHWLASGKKPGSNVLSSLVDVVAKVGGKTKGILLSSSGFTRDILNGRTEIEQHTVRIAGRNKIVSLCQNYLESVEGVWTPTTSLSEMLLEGSD
ncbi:restriction endonuclease [Pseudomonas sp. St29]|uniref:restriction endonuclease n=1 Tax=Pseudomonas sp. St29 TaxID=1500687 RepID=UPI0009E6F5A6|nr:restriction endonuclease [Pseudomonas sp. St29]